MKMHGFSAFMLLSILLCLIFPSGAFGTDASAEEVEVSSEVLLSVSKQRKWLTLLGYLNENKSAIKSENFFLSEVGHKDPLAELKATLVAFKKPTDVEALNNHAQCRFPARYLWLMSVLDFSALEIEAKNCPDYQAFIVGNDVKGLSVVFATGYFGNPASYYGHLLLKLNTSKQKKTDLESVAVNFGAIYPPTESMPIYIVKGVFGGYESAFTQQQYFSHSLNYGENDLRDLWEYELDLDKGEVALLVAHVWELLEKKYTYYFFNRNCAFRMAAAIELVLDERITNVYRPWQTPQRLIQQLSSVNRNEKSLVKSIVYTPSRQSRLYDLYHKLNREEKSFVRKIIADVEILEGKGFSQRTDEEKVAIINTLLDYYQYAKSKEIFDEERIKAEYRKVLAKRFLLPNSKRLTYSSEDFPHTGRKPSYLQVKKIKRGDDGPYSEGIKLRPAYYDTLDFSESHVQNSYLAMGEVDLEKSDDTWMLDSLKIVKVENFSRNETMLPGDKKHSWYIDVGIKNKPIDYPETRLAGVFNAGMGYSQKVFTNAILLSGFAAAGFEGRNTDEENIYAGFRSNVHLNITNRLRIRMEYQNKKFIRRDNIEEYEAEVRVGVAVNFDVRYLFKKSYGQEVNQIAVGYYW